MKSLIRTIVLLTATTLLAGNAFCEMLSIPLIKPTDNIAKSDWKLDDAWRKAPLKKTLSFDARPNSMEKQSGRYEARLSFDLNQIKEITEDPSYASTTTILRGFDAAAIQFVHKYAAKIKLAGPYKYELSIEFDIHTEEGTFRFKSNLIDPTSLTKEEVVKVGPGESFGAWQWEESAPFLGSMGKGLPISEVNGLDVCLVMDVKSQHTGSGTTYFITQDMQVNLMIEHR